VRDVLGVGKSLFAAPSPGAKVARWVWYKALRALCRCDFSSAVE